MMRCQNRAIDATARAVASERLCGAVEALVERLGVGCVALYAALADEPESRMLIEHLASKGVRVVLPRVEGEVMRFFDYAPDRVQCGSFGIEEPSVDATLCDPSDIELMVVPGVAFTASGARMGRGRGYYDKYLSQPSFRGRKVGICYAHQVVDELPTEPHDVTMDEVVTS